MKAALGQETPYPLETSHFMRITRRYSVLNGVTWNFDVGLPFVVVASSIKLHVSCGGTGEDGEAVGDDLPPRSQTRLRVVVFPKEGEGDP